MSVRHAAASSPPPWEVLLQVAYHLDPKTLATASCVCKSWLACMSSDHLWQPLCSAHFPSLSHLSAAAAVPHRHLYALGHASAARRLRKALKPRLSLHHLLFSIQIENIDVSHHVFAMLRPVSDLDIDSGGAFRFDITVEDENFEGFNVKGRLRVTWNVVLKGFKGVFVMMELEGWFSEELPSPECCSVGAASGLVADLRLGLGGSSYDGEKTVVEKVGVGVLSIVSWRYASVDDVLRYLQHFLLPSDV
ncbi:hypothetical protein NMG60_11001669 [Bertholletia excelsa]